MSTASPGGGGPPARSTLALAAWFGLLGGYLDVLLIVLKKDVFLASMYYNQGRHFVWTVPLGSVVVLLAPGAVVAAVNRLRPGTVPPRAAAGLFATLALWGPLLRAPLAGAASLVLAAGLGRWVSRPVAVGPAGLRPSVRRSLAGLAGLLGVSAAATLGGQWLAEWRAVARLPRAHPGAANVVLIVLDTVRAESLSLYGYPRDTTPHLSRWAKRGVRFDRAIAPAPWTLPSHGSFFTGEWPYKLNLHWQGALDPTTPTLAGYLASHGYQTAGFAANTNLCSYETGLGRGFHHYEDYPLTPGSVLASTAIGRWVVRNARDPRDAYGLKWTLLQSRGAGAINRAVLGWLSRRRPDRPFFAFLNYFDAHEPFVLPEGSRPRFGLKPESRRDLAFLIDYWDADKLALSARDVTLARDAYDDCIAYLDRQVGALLDELERRGELANTLVVITSDHGEEFGEHGVFNHGYSLYRHEIQVPLVILPPASSPAPGHVVGGPVSLRDLPATVVDVLGLAAGSPFPGRSLAGLWRPGHGSDPPRTSAALSESFVTPLLPPRRGRGPTQRGFAMSLVDGGRHYTRDSSGAEQLFDWSHDPLEQHDAMDSIGGASALREFRASLLRVLRADPARRGIGAAYVGRFAAALEALVGGLPRPGRGGG